MIHGPVLADSYIGYEQYPISTDPADWTAYRNGNAPFSNDASRGRDDALRIAIAPPRPKYGEDRWLGYWQRTNLPDGAAVLRGSLYIPEDWRMGTIHSNLDTTSVDFPHTGLWGTGPDSVPILHFTNHSYPPTGTWLPAGTRPGRGGVGRMVVWDTNSYPDKWSDFDTARYIIGSGISGWGEIADTAMLIEYDDWNDFEMRLLPDERKVEYSLNGRPIFVWEPNDPDFDFPAALSHIYLIARNEGLATYNSDWSELEARSLLASGADIGDTTYDVVVDPDADAARTARVTDGATLGGSLTSKGGIEGMAIDFPGAVTVEGDIDADNTALRFSTDPAKATVLKGGLALRDGSSAAGGSPVNPIQVNPDQTSDKGTVQIDATSRLAGHWKIYGRLDTYGTLSPGSEAAPIGTIRVDNPQMTETFAFVPNHFGENSVYEVNIDGDGNSDLLSVTGIVPLKGTVAVTPLDHDDFRVGYDYTIVEADGSFGDSGVFRFSAVEWADTVGERYPFYRPRLSYSRNGEEPKVWLTIDLHFADDAVYEATLDGATATKLTTEAYARLGGSVELTLGEGGYRLGHRYTIVETEDGFVDPKNRDDDSPTRFSKVEWASAALKARYPFVTPELNYDATNAYVSLKRNDMALASVTETANQEAVARAIDALGGGNDVHDVVAGASAAVARSTFDQLSGEVHASLRGGLVEDARSIRAATNERLRDIDGMWAWTKIFGEWADTEATANTAEVNRSHRGFLVGVDTEISEQLGTNWRVGLAAGASRTDFKVGARLSEAEAVSYHIAAYGGTSIDGGQGAIDVRLGAAQTWHGVDSERRVVVGRISETLTGDTDARTTQVFGEVGYGLDIETPAGPLAVEPFTNLAYVHHHADGISETGGEAALSSASSSENLGFSTAGIRANKTVPVDEGIQVTVSGEAGWQRAFGDVSPDVDVAFGGGKRFSVSGPAMPRNSAIVGLGVDVMFDEQNISLGAKYGGRFSNRTSGHDVTARLNIPF